MLVEDHVGRQVGGGKEDVSGVVVDERLTLVLKNAEFVVDWIEKVGAKK